MIFLLPDSNGNIQEIHSSQIYITESEKQVPEAKAKKELNSWKERNVYLEEEEDSGQP